MSYQITGIIVEEYPAVDISGKFRKREFVISVTEISNGFEFTEYIKFQLIQDRCNLIDPFSTGDRVKVSFNLRGRKWEKDGTLTYFTNLEAWKIERTEKENEAGINSVSIQDIPPASSEDEFTSTSTESDDLPF